MIFTTTATPTDTGINYKVELPGFAGPLVLEQSGHNRPSMLPEYPDSIAHMSTGGLGQILSSLQDAHDILVKNSQ